MPLFSVIIPSYNRKEQLKNAIDSVLEQSERDFEIILVDDGSDDGTADLADLYRGKIRYFFQQNSGVSSARNRGIMAAESPHIVLLDSDDTWHRNKLQKHREFIINNPDVHIHQTGDIWIRNGIRVNPGLKHLKQQGEIFIPSLELCLISPSSACIERSTFDKYGMFDPLLPACEDYDLWLRITPFEKTGLIPEKLITRYAGHKDQLSAAYSAMDRFRLYSILKLLVNQGDRLNTIYKNAAVESALKKGRILLQGAIKRGNVSLENKLRRIISQLEDGACRQTDYQSLLEKQDFL